MIFLIDDDEIQNIINRKIIGLVDQEVEVITFLDAQSALDELRKKESIPKVIFLDINMPRMNGWDFLEIYEREGVGLPVMILTSSINNHDKEKSKNFPSVRGFLSKPLSADGLKDILYELQ